MFPPSLKDLLPQIEFVLFHWDFSLSEQLLQTPKQEFQLLKIQSIASNTSVSAALMSKLSFLLALIGCFSASFAPCK